MSAYTFFLSVKKRCLAALLYLHTHSRDEISNKLTDVTAKCSYFGGLRNSNWELSLIIDTFIAETLLTHARAFPPAKLTEKKIAIHNTQSSGVSVSVVWR